MLTARDAVADRVAGLEAGADDYLVKPFAMRSSSRACTRARRGRDERDRLVFADLCSTRHARRAARRGPVSSSPRARARCSSCCCATRRSVVPRERALAEIWQEGGPCPRRRPLRHAACAASWASRRSSTRCAAWGSCCGHDAAGRAGPA